MTHFAPRPLRGAELVHLESIPQGPPLTLKLPIPDLRLTPKLHLSYASQPRGVSYAGPPRRVSHAAFLRFVTQDCVLARRKKPPCIMLGSHWDERCQIQLDWSFLVETCLGDVRPASSPGRGPPGLGPGLEPGAALDPASAPPPPRVAQIGVRPPGGRPRAPVFKLKPYEHQIGLPWSKSHWI